MRKTASEILNDLEIRIARLEKQSRNLGEYDEQELPVRVLPLSKSAEKEILGLIPNMVWADLAFEDAKVEMRDVFPTRLYKETKRGSLVKISTTLTLSPVYLSPKELAAFNPRQDLSSFVKGLIPRDWYAVFYPKTGFGPMSVSLERILKITEVGVAKLISLNSQDVFTLSIPVVFIAEEIHQDDDD